MEEHRLALRQSKADSVAPRLKPFMAMKRAMREPNGLWVCVVFVRLKSLALGLGSCPAQGLPGENHYLLNLITLLPNPSVLA